MLAFLVLWGGVWTLGGYSRISWIETKAFQKEAWWYSRLWVVIPGLVGLKQLHRYRARRSHHALGGYSRISWIETIVPKLGAGGPASSLGGYSRISWIETLNIRNLSP